MAESFRCGAYAFTPLRTDHLALLTSWLAEPHVATWWGDSAAEAALIERQLAEPGIEMFVVSQNGVAFAYLQEYDAHAAGDPALGEEPLGTRGIDQFIGRPELVGRGQGPAFVRAYCEDRFGYGYPRIVTDPDPANTRAFRAYEKAGFRTLRTADMSSGQVLLMARDNPNFSNVEEATAAYLSQVAQIEAGLAAADRGEFASDEDVARILRRLGANG